jgi:DNA-binding transcriptional LysR family regulator
MTVGLIGGQDVLTVANMSTKLEAQLRGLGSGFLPENLAMPYIKTGRLVEKRVERPERLSLFNYAWRKSIGSPHGNALKWWLEQLDSPQTRAALMGALPGIFLDVE